MASHCSLVLWTLSCGVLSWEGVCARSMDWCGVLYRDGVCACSKGTSCFLWRVPAHVRVRLPNCCLLSLESSCARSMATSCAHFQQAYALSIGLFRHSSKPDLVSGMMSATTALRLCSGSLVVGRRGLVWRWRVFFCSNFEYRIWRVVGESFVFAKVRVLCGRRGLMSVVVVRRDRDRIGDTRRIGRPFISSRFGSYHRSRGIVLRPRTVFQRTRFVCPWILSVLALRDGMELHEIRAAIHFWALCLERRHACAAAIAEGRDCHEVFSAERKDFVTFANLNLFCLPFEEKRTCHEIFSAMGGQCVFTKA